MELNQNIIAKIQKLLALGQSSNEAEATLAMARAQELLAKYNLEYAQVADAHVAGGTVEEKREKTRISRSAKYAWQVQLWKAIAEANFCWHWVVEVFEGKRGTSKVTSKVHVKRHMILGRESNVLACRIMGEYLEDTIERILPYNNNERMSRSANSWKKGCAERLAERVEAQAEKRKKDDAAKAKAPGSETALTLVDVYSREYAANYDVRYGEGAYARMIKDDAEWKAQQAEREAKAAADRAQAEKEWHDYLATETPEQRKQREREELKARIRAEKASERAWRSWNNERARESGKVDREAYRSGKKAGDGIGLDAQVSGGSVPKDRRLK